MAGSTLCLVFVILLWIFGVWGFMTKTPPTLPLALAPKESSGQLYGHPKPPVKTLYDKLLPPPSDHAWEIVVMPYHPPRRPHDDSLSLELRLINLIAPEGARVVDTKARDVIWYDATKTWEQHYRGRSHYGLQPKEAMDCYFLKGYIDWAQRHVDMAKIKSYEGGEYMVKGS